MNDLIILSLLLENPKHGYQLKREAGFILGHGEMHNNLVYPLLRRFTSAGWVTRKTVPGKRGQTREQYALTPSGRKQLLQQLAQFGEAEASSFAGFLTRVGMFGIVQPEIRGHILDQRESYLRAREQRISALGDHLEVGTYGGEVIHHLSKQIHSELAWIRRLRRLGPANKTTRDRGKGATA